MSSYDNLEELGKYLKRMVEKFQANPKHVIVFLQEEGVPEDIREVLEDHLNSICIRRGLGKFMRLERKGDQDQYLAIMADKFECDPKKIEDFMDEQQVPDNLRDELGRILKTIILLRGAAKTLRKAAGLPT